MGEIEKLWHLFEKYDRLERETRVIEVLKDLDYYEGAPE